MCLKVFRANHKAYASKIGTKKLVLPTHVHNLETLKTKNR